MHVNATRSLWISARARRYLGPARWIRGGKPDGKEHMVRDVHRMIFATQERVIALGKSSEVRGCHEGHTAL